MIRNSVSLTLAATALVFGLAAPAIAQSGKLVLYTSQPNTDAQQTVDAFKAKYPNVDISFVRDGTPRVIAKLQAEIIAGGSQADVLLIADSLTMESLKRDGHLLPHADADVSAYPASLHDIDKTWFATKLVTTGIVYHSSAPMKPSSWLDLVKLAAKGQVTMPSPLTSGAAMIHATTLAATLPGGWAYFEQLKANGAQAAGGNGNVLKSVAGGEKLYGMIVDFMPIREKAKGAPVEFVFPTEGVSTISEPVAILKSTKNPQAAKAFVDFLISRQGQELALAQGYMPAHPGVSLPAGFPVRDTISLMPFDAAKALASSEADKARFTQIFGQ
jgi:iron(III) transport system substrate-binding protein